MLLKQSILVGIARELTNDGLINFLKILSLGLNKFSKVVKPIDREKIRILVSVKLKSICYIDKRADVSSSLYNTKTSLFCHKVDSGLINQRICIIPECSEIDT